jgi:membrane-associated phospholipid phosphatase
MKRVFHWGVAASVCFSLTLLALPAWAQNLSIRDVPLKSWMGFGRQWDWTYDALRKLVISGLADRVVLNTKPMSRREMAIIVADMVRRIQANHVPGFETRTDLQDTLLDLMKELSPELQALGVTGPGISSEIPRWIEFKPIEYFQLRGAFSSNAATNIENSLGERLDKGINGRVTGSSWLEMGGFLAAYVQPEGELSQDTIRGRLREGYGKLRGGPVELIVGKESLWWGPGYHGSMMISNNALPLPMVRIRTANQIQLPWVFRDLFGPMKLEGYLATLEDGGPTFRDSKVIGTRVNLTPVPWLEIGLDRSIVFDGSNREPSLPWYRYGEVLFHGNQEGTQNDAAAGDNRFQLDLDFRFANVQKYLPFTRDAEFYVDFGWDDTCCGSPIIPIYPGYTIGAFFPNLFDSPNTDFRFEFTHAGGIQFVHSTWGPDWTRYGQVMSTFVGPNGEDIFFRLSQRFDEKVQVGLEGDFALIGARNTSFDESIPMMRKSYVGVDVTYQHSPALALNLGARLEWFKNRDHVIGQNGINQVYTAAVTYGFGPQLGAGKRRNVRPGDVPPVSVPEGPADPDEIASWAYAGKVFKDAGSVLTSPLDWGGKQWLIAGGVLAATGGAMLLDHEIRTVSQQNRSHTLNIAANQISDLGLILPAAGAGVSYLLGEVFHNQAAKERAADGVEAAVLSVGLFTYPGKFLIGRSRPTNDKGSQDYHPFNVSGSMPSLHTVEAFTAAAVLAEHWDNPWVSALAYGGASVVGWSRIEKDKHWFSDVVLSAAIGTAVGKIVVKLNQLRREAKSPSVSVTPLIAPGTYGAALEYRY